MILGFSTQLNGKPTYFVEKIWNSYDTEFAIDNFQNYFDLSEGYIFNDDAVSFNPKLHTIRDDPKDRWKAGMMIDFFINVRTKKMFRFAPKVPVIDTQTVLMTYAFNDVIQISIDDRELFGHYERLEFAINDGFDNWEDFFNYFYPKIKASPKGVYTAKLIQWTDLKY